MPRIGKAFLFIIVALLLNLKTLEARLAKPHTQAKRTTRQRPPARPKSRAPQRSPGDDLSNAAANNQFAEVKALLAKGVNVDAKDYIGKTALMAATVNN